MNYINKSNITLFIIILSTISGCSFFSKKDNPVVLTKTTRFDNDKIVNEKILSQGGKILVLPFRPGPNVEANEEVDKLAMVIIRGIVNAFEEKAGQTNLQIIFSDDQNQADFVLRGYITELIQPTKVGKWILRKNKTILSIEGSILRRNSSIPVLEIKDTLKSNTKSFLELGVLLGEKAGDFIIQKQ